MKGKRHLFFACLFIFILFVGGIFFYPPQPVYPGEGQSPASLKSFMFQFLELVSAIEALKKDGSTDWPAVSKEVKELRRNLNGLRKSATDEVYHPSLGSLSQSVGELEVLSRKKDPRFFSTLDSTKEKCFQCHATHHALGITRTKN